jgi:thiamine-phosphate pyrophosphorylase
MVSDSTMSRKKNILPIGLYGITAEKFSLGRNNIEVVQQMMKAGVEIIQYREKRTTKSSRDILQECLAIRRLTQDAGVTFIVNDYVDIALLTDADGVHVGQDDLPVTEVRKLLGRDKIIGLSTHSPEQAREAVKAGADYIGVGPIFATATKDDVCAPVGFDYLDYVAANISLPFVAIGGIKRHNIAEVKRRGAQTICLVTEIVGAPDVAARIAELHEVMQISA